MKAILRLLVVVVLLCGASTVGATVINFDDLEPVIGVPGMNYPNGEFIDPGIGDLPVDYAGFTWTLFGGIHKDYYGISWGFPGTGYEFGVVSGNYAAFNKYAEVASVNGSPFVLRSTYLTAGEFETLQVIVTGYRNGVVVYSTMVDTHMTSPTMFVFPTVKVDTVSFAPAVFGGVFVMDDFTYSTIPVVDAGPNVQVSSENQDAVVIHGTATDEDGEPLDYRWVEGQNIISDWQAVGLNGEANLELGPAATLSAGDHTLTLQVKLHNAEIIETDDMILTVSNSALHAVPIGGGTYDFAAPVTLGGEVSDYDGDTLTYQWLEENTILFTGTVAAVSGGASVLLPDHTVSDLTAGTHTLTLHVSDGINVAVVKEITVVINAPVTDNKPPKLCPKADKYILWPPNHQMVPVTIMANAVDNSGGPVTHAVTVKSNEPRCKKDKHEPDNDWTTPVIDQTTGKITLKLRAERNPKGDGRVYTITITATDQCGNTSKAVVKISVAKSASRDCDDKWDYWHNFHKSHWNEPGYKEWFDDFYSDWFHNNNH